MCLLIIAHQSDPRYPLVVAANRDEFHARPTAASAFWPEHPGLLAGRDLEQGGTWMGITRTGRFAAITNYRDPSRTAPAPRSRGELPLQFLTGDASPAAFLRDVAGRADGYAGFNLLLGDPQGLWYFSNSRTAGDSPQRLQPGIYGLSNAQLDTPWPKVILGKQRLQTLLESGSLDHNELAAVVGDKRLADPEELREHGMGNGMDHLLSAQFIITGTYGTRASTTLWITEDGQASWRELSFDAGGCVGGVQEKRFSIEAA
ncbi:MAG: NRDE family protein [Halioglobus sp.]